MRPRWPGELSGADPEGDGMANAVEFALGGTPTVPDRAATLPAGGFAEAGGQRYATLTFRLRKSLGGANVLLKASPNLTGADWFEVWSGAHLDAPEVLQRLDQGEFWRLTVRDTAPFTPGTPTRFLRLLVTLP